MASVDSRIGSVRLRTNVDFALIRKKLRLAHGPTVQWEDEISGTVLTDIDRDLEDCGTEVLRLDLEIHRLQSRMIFLRNQCQRLERYKLCIQSLRSPIRRLPNEILLRIFVYACGKNDLTSKDQLRMPSLTISHVNWHWRDLAKSYPDMWSCIWLDLGEVPRQLPSFPVLSLYLENSQQSALTITISGIAMESGHVLHAHDLALCSTIGEQRARWKRLAVVDPKATEALLSQGFQNFPLLEELDLSSFFPANWIGTSSSLARFQNAPKLCQLSVVNSLFMHRDGQDLHWGPQLTILKFSQFNEGLMDVLGLCTNLKELCFRESCIIPHNEAVLGLPITAPSVQKLIVLLHSEPDDDASQQTLAHVVFASLTCPSLSLLHLGCKPSWRPWPKHELHSFINRSPPCLTCLSMTSIAISDTDFIDLLRRLPSLRQLGIDDSNIPFGRSPLTSHLMQSLHAFPAESPVINTSALVPNLLFLDLTFSGSDELAAKSFSDSDFVSMVTSRWYSSSCATGYGLKLSASSDWIASLRSVVLRFTNRDLKDMKEDVYRPLKQLDQEGMRCVVIGKKL